MRVLEVIAGLGDGGAEIALMRRLRYQPDDVTTLVVTADEIPVDAARQLRDSHVDHIAQPLRRGTRDHVVDVVERHRPDVIVTHSPGETVRILAWRARLPVPVVVVAHHSLVSDVRRLRLAKELVVRRLNPRADLHIAVSEPAARGAQCVGARRVEVQVLGAEISDAPADDIWPSGTRVRLAAVSRLVWFKNLEGLVDAVSVVATDLRRSRAHLVIVGSGDHERAIADRIARHAIGDLVSMRPFARDPAGILRAADVLVSASTSEGGPLTLYEASLAGARLLATPVGAAAEVIAHDDASLLTAGASTPDLAAGLTRILTREPLAAHERAARATAAMRWHCSRTSAGFYDLVRSAARHGPDGSRPSSTWR